jgi:hypothetical protein
MPLLSMGVRGSVVSNVGLRWLTTTVRGRAQMKASRDSQSFHQDGARRTHRYLRVAIEARGSDARPSFFGSGGADVLGTRV